MKKAVNHSNFILCVVSAFFNSRGLVDLQVHMGRKKSFKKANFDIYQFKNKSKPKLSSSCFNSEFPVDRQLLTHFNSSDQLVRDRFSGARVPPSNCTELVSAASK